MKLFSKGIITFTSILRLELTTTILRMYFKMLDDVQNVISGFLGTFRKTQGKKTQAEKTSTQIIQKLNNSPTKTNIFPPKVLNLIDFAQDFAQISVSLN